MLFRAYYQWEEEEMSFLCCVSVDLCYPRCPKVLLMSCRRTNIVHYATLPLLCPARAAVALLSFISSLWGAQNQLVKCSQYLTGHSATAFEMLTGLAKPLGFFAPILSEHFLYISPISSVTLHFPHWICGYFIVCFTFLTTVGLGFGLFFFLASFFQQSVTSSMQQERSLSKTNDFNTIANFCACLKTCLVK